MDLDETWQVGLRPEKTKPYTFPAKSRYGFRREREKMGRRGVVFLWRERRTTSATFVGSISAKLSTNTCPGAGSRHMVSHSRKVSIKGSNFPKNPLCRVPYLCSAYGSRKTFCDAYTLPIPWWTSHRCALPRWLLLRDVPISSYPRPNVFLCHGINNGETWMPIFFQTLARGRDHRIADLQRYTNHCTFSSFQFRLTTEMAVVNTESHVNFLSHHYNVSTSWHCNDVIGNLHVTIWYVSFCCFLRPILLSSLQVYLKRQFFLTQIKIYDRLVDLAHILWFRLINI